MSSCSTVPASTSVYTSYSTSTVTGQQVSTVPGSTSTVSSAVLVTNCAAAPTASGDASGDAPASTCTTSTSYSVFATTVGGSTTTVYSTGETLVPVYSTAVVPASTICSAIQTSAPTSAPSRTTSDPVETPQSSATAASSQPVVIVGGGSSTRILTTTSTFIPTPSSAAASDPAVSAAVGAVTSTAKSQEMVLSTSYLTLVFTTTDNSGHASTYASAVPTLLNVPKNNAAATNKGAIAGATVGGVLALVLAVLAFLLMKKRGLFRKGDDEIEEDAWAPPAHGEYYGTATGRNRTATGGTLVGGGGGGGGFEDEKHEDTDRQVDAATLERHQSWYVAGGTGGRAMEEIYHEAQFATRSNSPQGYAGGAAEAIGAAAMGYQGVTRSRSDGGFGGGQPTRSASNRLSIYSANGGGSSHGHSQEHAPQSYPQHLPPIPDHRLSGFSYYPNYPVAQSAEGYRPASPPQQQRPRSASPTAQSQFDQSNHIRSNTLPHRLSSNGLNLPAHLRVDSYGSRPTLGAIQGNNGGDPSTSNSSSSSPSRGDTSESVPTTSTHLLQHSNSYGSASTNSPYSIPQLDRLKLQRPAFERAASTESFVAPVQWLGAKIANADSASESGLESKEDLTEKLQDLPQSYHSNPQLRA